MLELTSARIETVETILGADPNLTLAVFQKNIDMVAGKAVGVFQIVQIMRKAVRLRVVSVQTAQARTNPE